MFLFGKKQPKDVIPITIDLCDDYFVLNGKQFTIPARVSELVEILGEPRCVADRNKDVKTYKEMVCEKYNLSPEKFSEMDYYWDDLGLMASTHEQKTVRCRLGINHHYIVFLPNIVAILEGKYLKKWHLGMAT